MHRVHAGPGENTYALFSELHGTFSSLRSIFAYSGTEYYPLLCSTGLGKPAKIHTDHILSCHTEIKPSEAFET